MKQLKGALMMIPQIRSLPREELKRRRSQRNLNIYYFALQSVDML